LRLLILVAREGFLKDECDPQAKKFEHHCLRCTSKTAANLGMLLFT